ncbi:uncharacterized protein LOC116428011 isoform X1 [Nomia melanderi]|uniref:uncharacterized protein LOC116428011 isoform X1 n=1 Tax=Nomia melanderi TaxID=2448451 RepID=UPI003FCC5D37
MSGKNALEEAVKGAINSDYLEDRDYALGSCRRLLKLIGVWSLIQKRPSRLEKALSFLLRTMIFCIQLFFIIPIAIHVFYVEQNPNMKIKHIGSPSNCAFSVIKFIYLGLRGTEFRSCIEHIESDWRRVRDPQHRSIMLKQISTSSNLIVLCLFFFYAAGISYYTIIPLVTRRIQKENYTGRKLMHPGYDRYFDVHSSPTFELIYSAHCLSGFFRYSVTIAAFSLAVIFVTHISGQMQIQILRLRELCSRKDRNSVREQLSVIIHDHAKVLRFSKIVRDAFTEILLIEILNSALLMCFIEYCCLLEWKASNAVAATTYIIYMISFTFNAMIFCYIGEILSQQCSKIGLASYEVDWYNLPGTRGSDFILLNVISLYPPKLSGGKIIELSLNTFSIVSNYFSGVSCSKQFFPTFRENQSFG